MRLGVELVATCPQRLHLGSFFEMWLAVPRGVIRRSLGRDDYHLDLTVAAGRRLAATGRTHVCQVDAEQVGLGPNQARPAVLVPADLNPGEPLFLGLRTNVFLHAAQLTGQTRIRLLTDGAPPLEVALGGSDAGVDQVQPGRYLVDLTRLLPPGPGT